MKMEVCEIFDRIMAFMVATLCIITGFFLFFNFITIFQISTGAAIVGIFSSICLLVLSFPFAVISLARY